MSQLPSGQVLLAAFTTACGSNGAPDSRTCAAVSACSSSLGCQAIPDPSLQASEKTSPIVRSLEDQQEKEEKEGEKEKGDIQDFRNASPAPKGSN